MTTLTVSRDVWHGLNLSPMVYLNTVTLISEESEATAMEPHTWSKSEFEYGRKVLHSALEGARRGEEAFLKGRSLTPFLSEGFECLEAAAVGACIGRLLSAQETSPQPLLVKRWCSACWAGRLDWGGLAWKTRRLASASRARLSEYWQST